MAKIFNIFSSGKNKKDKGVTKEEYKESQKGGIKEFFKLLTSNFGRLTAVNLIFSLFMIPAILILIAKIGSPDGTLPTPQNSLYPQFFGISQYEPYSPVTAALDGVFGVFSTIAIDGIRTEILTYSGLLIFFTYGFANVGMTYILRAIVRRQHTYLWHDYMYTIKRNFRQALILGIIDLTVSGLLVYDLLVYRANDVNFLYNIFFYIILLFSILYFMMRFYMYLIMITFDLSLIKIIKNSFIFSLLGIKRNLAAVFGILVMCFLTFSLYYLIPSVGIIMPFIWTFSISAFISAYCAYPIIKRYMIDPVVKISDEDEKESDSEERVFTDRG